MTWSTRPSLPAGHRVTAANMDAILDQIDSLTAAGWTDYSASFSVIGSTTNPTKGNSTYAAYYRLAAGGDICEVAFRVTIGSTWSAGSGNYSFRLPFSPATPNIAVGSVLILDAGTALRIAVATPSDVTGYVYCYRENSSIPLGSAGPGTAWAAGDYVTVRYSYSV